MVNIRRVHITRSGYSGGSGGLDTDVYETVVDTSITTGESGATFTNAEALGEVILSLPPASAGVRYTFIVKSPEYLRIKAFGGDKIRYRTLETAEAGYIRSNNVGDAVTLIAVDSETWVAESSNGTFTIDS